MKQKLKEYNGIIFFIILFIIVILTAIIGGTIEKRQDIQQYNNGTCFVCDGEYRFASATYIRGGLYIYYYTCDKCGHTIGVHSLMQ